MPTNLRHRSRVLALQTLFELEFAAQNKKTVLQRNLAENGFTGEAAEFAEKLVNGVADNKQFLDETIGRFATAFPVDQLAAMDRNILRLALYEIMIANSAPPKVVINEAVELAKEFGADTAPRFINGVLGSAVASSNGKTQPTD